MLSVLTNSSAMAAVSALSATQRSLAGTETEISTGLRVSSAKDDAAYWSIATTMRTRIADLTALNGGLDIQSGSAGVATAALTTILSLSQAIASDVISAQTSGIDRTAIQTDIVQKQTAILAAAVTANYGTNNWLEGNYNEVDTQNVVYQYDTTAANAAAIDSRATTGSYDLTTSVTSDVSDQETQGANAAPETVENFHQVQVDSVQVTSTPNAHPLRGNHVVQTATGSSSTSSSSSAVYKLNLPTTVSDHGLLYASYSPLTIAAIGEDTYVDNVTTTYTDGSSSYSSTSTSPGARGLGDAALPGFFEPGQNVPTTIGNLSVIGASDSDLASMSSTVGQFIANVVTDQSIFGAMQVGIGLSKSFNLDLIQSLTSGVGALVDADMNESSTRLAALQTQQQLGVQSLSVANQNSDMILKLFGG